MKKKSRSKKARKPAKKAARKPAPKKARKPRKARKAARKAQPARVVVRKGPTLTPQEAQGMKVLAKLADNQFCEDGKLAHASAFVKALSDGERAAMAAARKRLSKTVGA